MLHSFTVVLQEQLEKTNVFSLFCMFCIAEKYTLQAGFFHDSYFISFLYNYFEQYESRCLICLSKFFVKVEAKGFKTCYYG